MKTVLFALLIATSQLHGQVTVSLLTDSTPARIMVRLGNDVSSLVPVLRREGFSSAQSKLDALADSLTGRVMADPASRNYYDPRYDAAIRALNTLVEAGRADSGDGRAYSGAYDRLVQIYERSPVVRIRERVLFALSSTLQRAQALGYLRRVAQSPSSMASVAVSALIDDSRGGVPGGKRISPTEREQSTAVLRELADNHAAVDRAAAQQLMLWSESQLRKP
jgi:hypothetical protein